jgi:hypothetical protein
MGLEVGGLIGLLVLALDLWALVHVFGSTASVGRKVIWSLLIVLLPVVGLIAWLLLGPRQRAATA